MCSWGQVYLVFGEFSWYCGGTWSWGGVPSIGGMYLVLVGCTLCGG